LKEEKLEFQESEYTAFYKRIVLDLHEMGKSAQSFDSLLEIVRKLTKAGWERIGHQALPFIATGFGDKDYSGDEEDTESIFHVPIHSSSQAFYSVGDQNASN